MLSKLDINNRDYVTDGRSLYRITESYTDGTYQIENCGTGFTHYVDYYFLKFMTKVQKEVKRKVGIPN